MAYLHAVTTFDLGWAVYALSALAGLLPEAFAVFQRRGFGRGGVGFGRRRGSFGLFRILFVLLFTTVLGPILLVALLAFLAFRFYAGRHR
ncbi:MAG TPA: hypothetical protein VGV91_18450 [Rubrobacter sp.]|jgi:hypothetical protein|nr:hypothetical protein [Rubrobacter sp.]